jgi:hypothetical protein
METVTEDGKILLFDEGLMRSASIPASLRRRNIPLSV